MGQGGTAQNAATLCDSEVKPECFNFTFKPMEPSSLAVRAE